MGGCLSIRIRENVMKCINVKCEGKPAYDIVIESGFGGLSEVYATKKEPASLKTSNFLLIKIIGIKTKKLRIIVQIPI